MKLNLDDKKYLNELKLKGNKNFSKKNYKESIKYYNKMLQLISVNNSNNEILSIALSNRGTCYFNLKKYFNSFLDLYYSIKFNNIEKYQNKLLKVIPLLINIDYYYLFIINDVLLFDFLNDECRNYLNQLKDNMSKNDDIESKSISIKNIDKKGMGIIANSYIEKNKCIIKESPILFIQTNHFDEYCSKCGRCNNNRFYCNNCSYGYCCLECYNNSFHICTIIEVLSKTEYAIPHFALSLYYYSLNDNENINRIKSLYCQLPNDKDKIERVKNDINKYLTMTKSLITKEIPDMNTLLEYYFKIAYNHQKVNIYLWLNNPSKPMAEMVYLYYYLEFS